MILFTRRGLYLFIMCMVAYHIAVDALKFHLEVKSSGMTPLEDFYVGLAIVEAIALFIVHKVYVWCWGGKL